MPPDDRDPAFGVVVGAVVGIVASVAIVSAIAAFGERALHWGAWAIVTFAEHAR